MISRIRHDGKEQKEIRRANRYHPISDQSQACQTISEDSELICIDSVTHGDGGVDKNNGIVAAMMTRLTTTLAMTTRSWNKHETAAAVEGMLVAKGKDKGRSRSGVGRPLPPK